MSDAKWNVMVYQAGDNNLSGEMVWALQQIKEVGPSEKLEVRVQFDPIGDFPRYFEFKKDPMESTGEPTYHQWHIRANLSTTETQRVAKEVEQLLDGKVQQEVISRRQKDQFLERGINDESSSPIMIEQFIKQTKSKFGNHFMLVLSGHGSGALGGFLKDYDPVSSISVPRLGQALRDAVGEGRGIHILGMDSCNMSMAEVCYEVRKSAEYLVGSEGFVMNSGWPYGEILSAIEGKLANNALTREVAITIVEEYTKFYANYALAGISVDLSAIHLESMESLAGAVRGLVEEMQKQIAIDRNPIVLARWEAQTYSNEEYVDLWDFCDLLQTHFGWSKTKGSENPGQKVKEALEAAVILSCYSGPAFQHSHGMSVYFPWTASDSVLQDYRKMDFSIKSHWGDFLGDFIKETRREVRVREDLSKDYLREAPLLNENMLLIRKNPPHGKGVPLHTCNVKNYPNKYYPSVCMEPKKTTG